MALSAQGQASAFPQEPCTAPPPPPRRSPPPPFADEKRDGQGLSQFTDSGLILDRQGSTWFLECSERLRAVDWIRGSSLLILPLGGSGGQECGMPT